MVLFHLGDPLIDGFGMQITKLHCCRVPDCRVLKHKRKPLGNLLAGGRKHGTWQGLWEEVAGKSCTCKQVRNSRGWWCTVPSWARAGWNGRGRMKQSYTSKTKTMSWAMGPVRARLLLSGASFFMLRSPKQIPLVHHCHQAGSGFQASSFASHHTRLFH